MAHEFETGFVVREPAWHGLAEVIPDYVRDWPTARKLAGLEWEPVEAPVYVGEPLTAESFAGGPEAPADLPGWKAIRRSDTGAVLSVNRDSYELFPNAELGPLAEALLDDPEVQYETAGVLKGGTKVWVMLKLAEPFEIPGDPRGATLSRLAIQNSHDGTGALRAQRLQTRIVCDNTSQAADREAGKHGMEFKFSHTKNMRDRVEEAKRVLAGLRSDRDRYAEWATDLLGLRVSEDQREEFVQRFIPEPAADVISNRVRVNIDTARDDLRVILASPTVRDTQHTAYGLVQAATEYLDHSRRARTDEAHFKRCYLSKEPLKKQAEKLAREAALA